MVYGYYCSNKPLNKVIQYMGRLSSKGKALWLKAHFTSPIKIVKLSQQNYLGQNEVRILHWMR